jgi:hypothetical protein
MSKIIITVTRPELTTEEKADRMEELKKATADFMRAVEKGRNNNEKSD